MVRRKEHEGEIYLVAGQTRRDLAAHTVDRVGGNVRTRERALNFHWFHEVSSTRENRVRPVVVRSVTRYLYRKRSKVTFSI